MRPLRAARIVPPTKLGTKCTVSSSYRLAAVTVAQPVTLRLTSTRGPPAAVQAQAAFRDMKRAQRFIRQTEAMLRKAEAETTRRAIRPTRPLRSSRSALWRWYQANGWSWARFVADHGEP